MLALWLGIVWFFSVTFSADAVSVKDVENNLDTVCSISDFDHYRMERNIAPFLELADRESSMENTGRYARYIQKRKSKKMRVKFGKPQYDLLAMNQENLEPRVAFIVEYLHILNFPLLHKANKLCSAEIIAEEMRAYNNGKITGLEACKVGTNLRKIEHLFRIADNGEQSDIFEIFLFFLPELGTCWKEVRNIVEFREIISHMHRVASEFRLKQNDALFPEERLTYHHVVMHLPPNELECIQPGHVTGTVAFRRLINYFENHFINTLGIFRVPAVKTDPKIREILYAVIRNADNMQDVLETLQPKSPLIAHVTRKLITILMVTFDEQAQVLATGDTTDVTSEFLRLIHSAYYNHVCIEAILVKFVMLGLRLTENFLTNMVSIEYICTTPLTSMFDISDKNLVKVNFILLFCNKLLHHFNQPAIDEHFNWHYSHNGELSTSNVINHSATRYTYPTYASMDTARAATGETRDEGNPGVQDVENNLDTVCCMADFDHYRMEKNVEQLLEAAEQDWTIESVVHYVNYINIFSPDKIRVRIGQPNYDLLALTTENVEPRIAVIIEYFYILHFPLLHHGDNLCDADIIAEEMRRHNIGKIASREACMVGSNLRKIDHLFALVREGQREDVYIILSFFLPELKACWREGGDIQNIRDIISHMRNVASELRLKQNAAFFPEEKLSLHHVVKYLPTDELECIQPGHTTSTLAFRELIDYVEENGLYASAVFRNLPVKANPEVLEMFFAVVSNSNNIRSVLDSIKPDATTISDVMTKFTSILVVAYDEQALDVATGDTADVTHEFIRLIHHTHHRHVCLEAILVEFVIWGIRIKQNFQRNLIQTSEICKNALNSMFNTGVRSDMPTDVSLVPFCVKLIFYFNRTAIAEHFKWHSQNAELLASNTVVHSVSLGESFKDPPDGISTAVLNEVNDHRNIAEDDSRDALVQHDTTAHSDSGLRHVENNLDTICCVADFDHYRMERNIELFLDVAEGESSNEDAAHYVNYIHNRNTNKINVKISQPNYDLLGLNSENIGPRISFIVEYLHILYLPLIEPRSKLCDADRIAEEMRRYNSDKIVGQQACLVGTNLRKIDHLFTLIGKWNQEDISKIFAFFLPELKECWNKISSIQNFREIILHMRKVASELRLKQNVAFFPEERLTLQHVIKYLPINELECIQPDQVTGTMAFHTFITYFENNFKQTAGIFCNLPRKSDPKIREILFAVVLNADNMQSILESLKPSVYMMAHITSRLMNILIIAFDEQAQELASGDATDVTTDFIRLMHDTHQHHVCIEAILVKFVTLSIWISKNFVTSWISSGYTCSTPLISMFDSRDRDEPNVTSVLLFCGKLIRYFNQAAIDEHFKWHRFQSADAFASIGIGHAVPVHMSLPCVADSSKAGQGEAEKRRNSAEAELGILYAAASERINDGGDWNLMDASHTKSAESLSSLSLSSLSLSSLSSLSTAVTTIVDKDDSVSVLPMTEWHQRASTDSESEVASYSRKEIDAEGSDGEDVTPSDGDSTESSDDQNFLGHTMSTTVSPFSVRKIIAMFDSYTSGTATQ